MAYKKLSEQLQELDNPQRSDAFVKAFREAVREGQIEATYLPERFTLPKQFTRRGAEGNYQRDSREMLFEMTPAFEKWFAQTNSGLAAAARSRGGQPKATAENIESGAVDFKTLAEETRRKMQASYEKGQALGKSRSQSGGATKKSGASRGRAKSK